MSGEIHLRNQWPVDGPHCIAERFLVATLATVDGQQIGAHATYANKPGRVTHPRIKGLRVSGPTRIEALSVDFIRLGGDFIPCANIAGKERACGSGAKQGRKAREAVLVYM
jgi:hypothetical protein